MRKIYFCISILLLVFSCKKNGESEIVPTPILKDRCKLIDSKTYNAAGVLTSSSQYVYDVEERITKITTENYTNGLKSIENLEYLSNGKIAKYLQISLGNTATTYSKEYTYKVDKLATLTIKSGNISWVTDYEYGSDGLLKQTKEYNTSSGNRVLDLIITFEYDSQKRVVYELVDFLTSGYTEYYFEYDNRNNQIKLTYNSTTTFGKGKWVYEYAFSDIKNPQMILDKKSYNDGGLNPNYRISSTQKSLVGDILSVNTNKVTKVNLQNYPEEVLKDDKSRTVYTYKDCE